MKARLILTCCLLLGFVISPFLLAVADYGTFYLYTDFDGDNKPDQRITFAGDYTRDFIELIKFHPAAACTGHFNRAWFRTLNCPSLSCPMEQPTCTPRYPRIKTIYTTPGYACHCVHEAKRSSFGEDTGQTHGYVAIDDTTFQLLPLSREEFENYLMTSFRVIETVSLKEKGLRGLEPCDEGVTWVIDWNCKGLECSTGYVCVKNTATTVTDIVVEGGVLCRCTKGPSLTGWGIMALVVLLLTSGMFVMLRRRKASVAA